MYESSISFLSPLCLIGDRQLDTTDVAPVLLGEHAQQQDCYNTRGPAPHAVTYVESLPDLCPLHHLHLAVDLHNVDPHQQ